MKYRLLLDLEVVEFFASLPRRDQLRLRQRLHEIRERPDQFADFQEPDSKGRLLDVHVCFGFGIYFWDDVADRHIKVLRIRRAER